MSSKTLLNRVSRFRNEVNPEIWNKDPEQWHMAESDLRTNVLKYVAKHGADDNIIAACQLLIEIESMRNLVRWFA